ncbi:MAG: FecR family protein [Chitinophagaceae bacterium]|nr:FecR family protein [Chitinophagaceae bacterium]
MADAQHIAHLFAMSLAGVLSDEDKQELDAWINASDDHRLFADEVNDREVFLSDLQTLQPGYLSDREQQTLARIKAELFPEREIKYSMHRIHFLKTTWFRYAAAIILIFGIGAYLWNTQQKAKPLITSTKPVPVKNDVLPGGQKATLTLSDGKKIELNNAASETITDGSLSINNNNGQLVYGQTGRGEINGSVVQQRDNGKIAYNTMSTPSGGQYQVILPDGTKVWLNAVSSITYPTVFTDENRTVTINGELYFEVAKNIHKPFIVKVANQQITVLGTEFNVNAYTDEPVLKTSLIEGSVRVGSQVLKPGEACINGKVFITNIEQDVAWKKGVFSFSQADIKTVMRQIARWYDVQVKFVGELPTGKLTGKIDRNLTLIEVLDLLSQSKFKYTLEKKVLTIFPANTSK